MVEVIFIAVISGGLLLAYTHHQKKRARAAAEAWAARKGLHLRSLDGGKREYAPHSGGVHHRRHRIVLWTFRFVAVSRASGDRLTGKVRVQMGLHPRVDGEYDRAALQAVKAESEPAPALTREEQIRGEVNRRLDQLTTNPQEMMRHDANADGAIDSEEWNAVRARIEAEVRAEFSDSPDDDANDQSDAIW